MDHATWTTQLRQRFQRFMKTQCGEFCRVESLAAMAEGHAGLTFAVDVAQQPGEPCASYVLKVAPVGVKRRGNTDVFRQVPLLRALSACGLPVPRVLWASASERELGTPFLVMERLPGRTFVCWEPHRAFARDPESVRPLWLQAARLLAEVHRFDWQARLPRWERPRDLPEELERWEPVLAHAQHPHWIEAGHALAGRLLRSMPRTSAVGLVHGDYQPGNILYHQRGIVGLVDWELAFVGPQGLDVGWLLMMSDPDSWAPNWQPFAPVSATELIQAYRDAGGLAAANSRWFHALANYRMGAIACLNVKLHRTGKRPDALWERFAPSIDYLFTRGMQLLGGSEAVQQAGDSE